jgi:hypothetical protein
MEMGPWVVVQVLDVNLSSIGFQRVKNNGAHFMGLGVVISS